MRSSTDLRPPGVYTSALEPTIAPFVVADTKVAGFVGIAQRGPLDEARRVTSWDEFCEIYGTDREGYLTDAVEAYFKNGGEVCHVVRVAHRAPAGVAPGPEHAARAELLLLDAWKKPTLRVTASSEGVWGNGVWVGVRHAVGASALLTADLELGVDQAQVSSTRGFKVGAV